MSKRAMIFLTVLCTGITMAIGAWTALSKGDPLAVGLYVGALLFTCWLAYRAGRTMP